MPNNSSLHILRSTRHIQPCHQGGVVTIGKFDGLHLGHQKAIQSIQQIARQRSMPHTLITFEPSPLEYFAGNDAPPRLTAFSEKMRLLETYGIKNCLCLHFDRRLMQQSAHDFVQSLLVDTLKIKHIIIGDDFNFGARRQGNIELLQAIGCQAGFQAETLPTVQLDQQRVSSTLVRDALKTGDLALVRRLLDRDYAITGRVIYGAQQGRTIGFPTANIAFRQHRPAMTGVFVVTVTGISHRELRGVANIGTRPTVHGVKPLLEVHLFNFSDSLYGQRLTVHFKKKLRDEQRFPTFEALQKQIRHDAIRAHNYFHTID